MRKRERNLMKAKRGMLIAKHWRMKLYRRNRTEKSATSHKRPVEELLSRTKNPCESYYVIVEVMTAVANEEFAVEMSWRTSCSLRMKHP
jgi:hypothetical protein